MRVAKSKRKTCPGSAQSTRATAGNKVKCKVCGRRLTARPRPRGEGNMVPVHSPKQWRLV